MRKSIITCDSCKSEIHKPFFCIRTAEIDYVTFNDLNIDYLDIHNLLKTDGVVKDFCDVYCFKDYMNTMFERAAVFKSNPNQEGK